MTESSAAMRHVQVAVGKWLDQYLPRGRTLTVACSGGADSLALAYAAFHEGTRQGHPVRAATVDHGLQAASADRARLTADQLSDIGYQDVRVLSVQVGTDGGLEAAARTARYAALHPLAAGGAILIGHTLDDQAETVLLGLSRGSGPRSISGMRAWSAPYGRPLLGLRRRDTEAACAEVGLSFWSDPHNKDPRFARVRLRQEALPLLEDILGGGVVAALARTAGQLAEDLDVLDEIAQHRLRDLLAAAPADRIRQLPATELAHEPNALRRRILRLWLLANGIRGLTAAHLDRVNRYFGPGGTNLGPVRLPGQLDVTLVEGWLDLRPGAAAGGRRVR